MKFFKINLHVWFNESVDILKAVDRSSWPDTEKSIICHGTVGVTILSPNIDTVVSLNTNNRANLRVNSKKENTSTSILNTGTLRSQDPVAPGESKGSRYSERLHFQFSFHCISKLPLSLRTSLSSLGSLQQGQSR